MKPIKVVIVGNGERATCYCKYALQAPENLQVVAIVDPDINKLEEGSAMYGVPRAHCFESVEEFLSKREALGIQADGVVNATMDEYHYQTAIPLLKAGYHMLLEKPVVNNIEQLLEIQRIAEENGCLLMVCHVLRYTPFYRSIKEVIASGEIGEIVHIETSENVGVAHSSNSYIRGKWNSREKCGSSMLLAKCCHDLDLLCWLNNTTQPTKVASFGGRDFIVPEKAPVQAGTKCLVDCPHVNDCRYSAQSIYVKNDRFPWYSWQCLNKPYEQATREEKTQSLKTFNPHGECAFKTKSDLVDHQAVIMQFRNGSTATHSMIQGAIRPCRTIRVMGTEGEIDGMIETCVYHVRKYDFETAEYTEKSYDVRKDIPENDHHAGGDEGIIIDFIRMLRKEKPSISCTKIQDSIYGHLCVYKADESMEDGVIKEIKEF
ncbi:MAG: Gfo/Idh/MocA family oxidoreductase [Clostridiales bacterium]|nr:Gfo/Idh/MocA family oxidoreductase [Clostridiales bacterium]